MYIFWICFIRYIILNRIATKSVHKRTDGPPFKLFFKLLKIYSRRTNSFEKNVVWNLSIYQWIFKGFGGSSVKIINNLERGNSIYPPPLSIDFPRRHPVKWYPSPSTKIPFPLQLIKFCKTGLSGLGRCRQIGSENHLYPSSPISSRGVGAAADSTGRKIETFKRIRQWPVIDIVAKGLVQSLYEISATIRDFEHHIRDSSLAYSFTISGENLLVYLHVKESYSPVFPFPIFAHQWGHHNRNELEKNLIFKTPCTSSN